MRQRGGIWYVRVKPRGYPHRITASTGSADRAVAAGYEATLRRLAAAGRHDLLDAVHTGRLTCQQVYAADLAGRLHELRPEDRPLADAVTAFLELNPGAAYQVTCRRLLDVAPTGVPGHWITDPRNIGKVIARMRRDGLKDGTIRRDLMVVSKLIAYEYGPAQRTETMGRVDKPAGGVRDRWYTDTEIAAVRQHAGELWPLIALSLATGVRRGELLRLDLSDIDLEHGYVRIRSGKSQNARRRVPVPGTVVDMLRNEIARQGRAQGRLWADWTVDRVRLAWERCRDAAELEDAHWHDLRRTYGVNCARAGVPLPELQRYMGHASVTTTVKHYGDYAPDRDRPELDAAMRAMGLSQATGELRAVK